MGTHMKNPIRTILGRSGVHLEREHGQVRWDTKTGKTSLVFGEHGKGTRMVTRPNGKSVIEQQYGNLRFSSDRGTETLL